MASGESSRLTMGVRMLSVGVRVFSKLWCKGVLFDFVVETL